MNTRNGNSKRPGFFAALLMLVLGGACIFAGVSVHRSHTPYDNGISTTGTISDIHKGTGRDGKTYYTAVYEFTTADGRTVTFEDPSSGSSRPTMGDKVEISYLLADPEGARRIPGVDWFAWLFLGVGVLIALLGLVILLASLLRAGFRVASIVKG